jgi:hypothetical protein
MAKSLGAALSASWWTAASAAKRKFKFAESCREEESLILEI